MRSANKPGPALTEARSRMPSIHSPPTRCSLEASSSRTTRRLSALSAGATWPTNPETWYQLGAFELFIKRPRAAYRDLNHAYTLDNFLFGPKTLAGRQLDEARCKIDPATCR
jgi:hypothetical protein